MKALAQNTLIQNRYLIVQLIGKGGMGEVYLAVDQRLGSAVALKRCYFAGDETLGGAFEREARVLARMRHPVLPKVSDHFGEGDEQFLVMEHISGEDLSKRLEAAQKPFPVSWVMFWADQLLDALSYLHSHEPPIIHRDIKPQNLKLTDENHIILLDFGLSKTSTGQTNIGPNSTGSTGSVVGYTPHYAPMEQIRGIGTSAKSDLYSLSATLYQLLTNTVPMDALSRADSMLNGDDDPIRPLFELNPEVPADISEVVLHGMEVSQEKRFANAREMQKALRRAFSEMQNAMSAQTVAISAADLAASHSQADTSGIASDPQISPTAEPSEALEPDFGATIAFDHFPSVQPDEAQQSGIKTEVFLAGSGGFPSTPFHEEPAAYEGTPSIYEPTQTEPGEVDFGMTNDYRSGVTAESSENSFAEDSNFSPNATVPIIAFDGASEYGHESGSSPDQPEAFATMAASGDEFSASGNDDDAALAAPAAATAAKKKGGAGKIVAILAGLFLLLILGVGGAVGVWYYMNYYGAGAYGDSSPTPTPTPEDPTPSPTATPTPETTPSPSPTPTATPFGSVVEPTPVPDEDDGPGPTGPRPTPNRTGPRPTPGRVPTPRPTPRRTPGVLQ
jgi:serine/threonine protein kinase